ncbi:carboxylating nicotinate-nucleotide diphosphorylase [Alkalicoccus daliensis]|uniref:Probable nicotinate-nucleotide pyrophosphorylase [carboxylating] n=1 Tax=Alkalicoccus daliensis TaxID=745820 RepID=A0A1H0DQ57_9BACI|nr:carboxylating nicotinate-nucleotide diphosphorylase [Alkalicoccus daliensis]SDN72199.1 nicotinate-nucleotide pyrophosphorylase [carboxylating] [Alkalicoccus daliensis]
MNLISLREKLKEYFNEDIGFGDITAEAVLNNEIGGAQIIVKEPGVFFGELIIKEGFALIDPSLEIQFYKRDGEEVVSHEAVAEITGSCRSILTGERVILNLIQRLSGIATFTRAAVEEVEGTGVQITDTRKTTPGLRMMEKAAVRAGGGKNHRARLDDALLIKENHIAAAGSIKEAVYKAKKRAGHMLKIEVEVENEKEVLEAVEASPDVIMFDNCTPAQAKKWALLVPEEINTEISGGLAPGMLREAAETGVDFLSIGALTHSAGILDMSLLLTMRNDDSQHADAERKKNYEFI